MTTMESIIPTAEDLFLIVEEANKPLSKRVSFDTNVITHDSNSEFECDTRVRWYTKPEIAFLQKQVHLASAAITRGDRLSPDIDKEDDLRGLEPYVDKARLAYKKRVIAHVIKAQITFKCSSLAKLSHDCTTWHKKIALIYAHHSNL